MMKWKNMALVDAGGFDPMCNKQCIAHARDQE